MSYNQGFESAQGRSMYQVLIIDWEPSCLKIKPAIGGGSVHRTLVVNATLFQEGGRPASNKDVHNINDGMLPCG